MVFIKQNDLEKHARLYSLTAQCWSVIFFIAGIFFLAFPGTTVDHINLLARILGLKGTITAPPATLWHILTLSLMGILTLLAAVSARHPEQSTPYTALMTAKIISVAGFLALAFTQGAAWLLCAFADGFVALTLFITRTGFHIPGMVAGFQRIMPLKTPHYEVWFGKIDLSPGRALWFRYTLLNGVKKEAAVWALLFENEKITAGKKTFPLNCLAPPNSVIVPDENDAGDCEKIPQVFHLGANHLDGTHAKGAAGAVSWDLVFEDSSQRFEHVPRLLKRLHLVKSIYSSCFLNLHFTGTVKNGTETITVLKKPGMIGHIYGKKSAHSWSWAHCNNFEGRDDVVFEGLSARIRIAGRISSPISSFILIAGGRRYAFSSITKMFAFRSEYEEGIWRFSAKTSCAILTGIATAPQRNAVVEYTEPDNSKLWCRNSKLARLKLELKHCKTNLVEVFETSNTAAFEIVNRINPGCPHDLG